MAIKKGQMANNLWKQKWSETSKSVVAMGSEQSTPAAAPSSASDPLYSLASPVTERQESVCSEADPEVGELLNGRWR